MVVIGVHWVGARAMLMQNVEVQRLRPPLSDAVPEFGIPAMHDGAAAFRIDVISVHFTLPRDCSAKPLNF